MRRFVLLSVLFAIALSSACGQDNERGITDVQTERGRARAHDGVPVPFAPGTHGPTPFGEIPFPSDLYLNASGNVGEVPNIERVLTNPERIRAGLAALDGFGRSSGALFFMDAPIDVESLPRSWEEANRENASVLIVDVDPNSPHLGTRYPAIAKALPSIGCVSVLPVPGVVLPAKTRHAVVLTDRVTSEGHPLIANAELARIADSGAHARSTPAEELYGQAIDQLLTTGDVQERASIASLAVFTTSNRAQELFDLRDRLRSEPAPDLIVDDTVVDPYTVAVFGTSTTPSLDDWLGAPEIDETGREWPGGDNPGGIAHDQIGAVVSGAFVAPRFLDATTQHFERDASGEYVLSDANATIPVTLIVPRAAPPPSGYPVIINGHGLSNNRGSVLGIANELCRAGFAVIGIDDVEHGSRAGIKDLNNNHRGSYQGPDGIPDDLPLAVSFFAGFSDFVAVRDNFRQTILDQASLVRLIQNPNLTLAPLTAATGGVVARLDPDRIYWSGGSLGGIIGAMTTAVEPDIRAAALQVPGASFIQLITTASAKLSDLVTVLVGGSFGLVGDDVADEFHPLAHFLAQITEAGDPIAYAGHVLRDPLDGREPRDILLTYAVDDEVMPNIATIALVRALGLELASPNIIELPGVPTIAGPVSANVEGKTGVAVQYGPANHGLGYVRDDIREYVPGGPGDSAPRFSKLPATFPIEMPIREHVEQLVQFFLSADSGRATVEVTAPPIADFDDDGVSDDLDASPYDPTRQ
jgi:dienelactone hydrolase